MKVLSRGISKEQIVGVKKYSKWYKVIDGEIMIIINEEKKDSKKELVNDVQWKNNKALICLDSEEYRAKFFNKHKDLKVKLFVKLDTGLLYNQYETIGWSLKDNAIEIDLA